LEVKYKNNNKMIKALNLKKIAEEVNWKLKPKSYLLVIRGPNIECRFSLEKRNLKKKLLRLMVVDIVYSCSLKHCGRFYML